MSAARTYRRAYGTRDERDPRNVLRDAYFAQPFNTGTWQASQAQVGFYYDATRHLALNDGGYSGVQYLYQQFAPISLPNGFLVRVKLIPHPAGLANSVGAGMRLYVGAQTYKQAAVAAIYEFHCPDTGTDAIYFETQGAVITAIKSVEIIPL